MTRVGAIGFPGQLARAVGLLLFCIALFRYEAYENRVVLGRWSYPFSVLILAAGLLLFFAILRAWKARPGQVGHSNTAGSLLADFAILSWGCGYFVSALEASDNGARIAELNLFGSLVPAAALLEWLALVLLALAPAPALWKNRNSKWSGGGLTLLPTVLLVLLLEGGARLLTIVTPASHDFRTYSSTLWERKYATLNRAGFRDQEHTLERAANTRRLVVVGDSYAYGWGIKRVEDRFGEQLAKKLIAGTGDPWELINASWPGTDTGDHIEFARRTQAYRPDLVILVYVFNDIAYLSSPREGPGGPLNSVLHHLNPVRILFQNSYLFQEAYLRLRLIWYDFPSQRHRKGDPYSDRDMLTTHLTDLSRFVSIASQTRAVVAVVPFDVAITRNVAARQRYTDFVNRALASGIPTWPAERAFMGHDLDELRVSKLDRHPNELANHLLAEVVATQALKQRWAR